MLRVYFKALYQRTINESYRTAYDHILQGMSEGTMLLDCGANSGTTFDRISMRHPITSAQYHGIEWNTQCARRGQQRGLDIVLGDLNTGICKSDETYDCVSALSVLEHLLNPCLFLRDSYRVLKAGGKLVLLTPNISTYFTAALIMAGKMPSSGPHPDSDALIKSEEIIKVSGAALQPDAEIDTPMHRHLVIFSYRVLLRYLGMIGFTDIQGHGFGLYPFPNLVQPALEKFDPWHCHQMVFSARKPG